MAPRKAVDYHMRWRVRIPDIGVDFAYVEVGATSLTLTWSKSEKHIIPFDMLEMSEAAGTIVARRNLCVVANLTRD